MRTSVAGWVGHRWTAYLVVAVWVALLVGLGPLAGRLADVQDNDAASWLPGSAESTRALERSEAFVSSDEIPGVVVYERRSGLTPEDLAAIARDARAIASLRGISGDVVGPVPSRDGQAAQVIASFDLGPDGFERAGALADDLRDAAGQGLDGVDVHVTGPLGQAADQSAAFEGIDTTLLLAAAGVVVVMLLLTYRSPVLWLLPLVSAGVSLAVAQAVVYLLAKDGGLTVNAQSAGILTVLVFGAGTDYALLLVARYREELRRHEDRRAAMSVALHRAGPAVIASAATVVVSMLCLLLAQLNSTRGLGPVAAVGIAVGMVVMLTLLPSLLVLAGRWVFWPRVPNLGDPDPADGQTIWTRVGRAVARAPRVTWIVTCVLLGAMALGVVQLDANGLSNDEQFTTTQPSTRGEEALARHFPGGAGSPVTVVADADQAPAVRTAFAGVDGIEGSTVTPPVVRDGTAFMQGTLIAEPDSQAAEDTVTRVRAAVHAVDGADALVGGQTALVLDTNEASTADSLLIIPIILLVVLLILGALLRSVVASLLLIGTVVLSFGAALGVSALVFRHLLGFGGADPSFPLFAFVFLVALGIDYNIFLVTRVREESVLLGTRRAALVGLAATGGVITSAGLVLAGTFAVLGTLPLVFLAELGFAVAFGVLLDTIVVRSVLVTALTLDVGRHMWWPSALSRREPAPSPAPDPDDEVLVP